MGHRRAQRVDSDLDEIWFYIARESGNVEIADQFIKSLTDHFYLISENPYLGRPRDADLRIGVRSFPWAATSSCTASKTRTLWFFMSCMATVT